jgi:predicted DNA-binding protein
MAKTEVYSWRLSPDLKDSLDALARSQGRSLADLLEEMAMERIERGSDAGQEWERQEKLRAAAMRFVGALSGDDPDRAATSRELVRARLAARHGR